MAPLVRRRLQARPEILGEMTDGAHHRVGREAAERAQTVFRLAQWISIGAGREDARLPSFQQELCSGARAVFAKHQTFFLYASTGETRYRPEALEFLCMVIAYSNGKAGKEADPAPIACATRPTLPLAD